MSGRRPRWAVVVVPLLLVAGLVAPAPASGQAVAIELTVDPLFPATIAVGQTGAAQLRIRSVAAGGTLPVEVTVLSLLPACGSLALDCPLGARPSRTAGQQLHAGVRVHRAQAAGVRRRRHG